MPDHICYWHQCRAPFASNHQFAKFCCPAHRVAHAEWSKARGAAIVNVIVDTQGDKDLFVVKILEQRRKILDEIEK